MKKAPARSVAVSFATFALGAAVLACGSGGKGDIHKDDGSAANARGPGDGTNAPGSRLAPMSYLGSDGSKAFAGWFDKKLGKECAFDRLGFFGVCVPADVYTVSVDLYSDSLKTGSPALYLDPSCEDRSAIALDDSADCTHYGVIRFTGGANPVSYARGCGEGASYGTGLAIITPIPEGTKIYAFGQGGGQCCSCKEWVPPEGARAYHVESSPTDVNLAGIKLVTATIDAPTAP